MEETLLDSRKVSRLLDISRSHVYYLVNTGALPCVRLGSTVRVSACVICSDSSGAAADRVAFVARACRPSLRPGLRP